MENFLALDPGGSKCGALLVSSNGSVVGWKELRLDGITGRHFTLQLSACKQVLAQYNGGPVNFISYHYPPFLAAPEIKESINGTINFLLVTESEAARSLANEIDGLVLLAGTGAVANLKITNRQSENMDGLGPLIGDFGGGFWIGQEALRAVTRSTMHNRYATSLNKIIHPWLANGKWNRIMSFEVSSNDRATVAELASLVNHEAEAGDQVSLDILHRAAHELAETVFSILDNNQLLKSSLPLIGTGSILCKSDIVWKRLVAEVGRFAPRLRFVRLSQLPAVAGVALAGAKLIMNAIDYEKYRAGLLNTFKELLSKEVENDSGDVFK